MGIKKGKRIKKGNLGEVTSAAVLTQPGITEKQVTISMFSFLGGAVAANFVGKYSGYLGLAIGGWGLWKKNFYAASVGAGLILTQQAQKSVLGSLEDEGMEGLNFKQGMENTKNYFKNIGNKFLLKEPTPAQTTSGLSGQEQTATYFVNPLSGQSNTIDLSELDKLSAQIAQMQGTTEDIPEAEPIEGAVQEAAEAETPAMELDFSERNF
jgi:hypothetical protein